MDVGGDLHGVADVRREELVEPVAAAAATRITNQAAITTKIAASDQKAKTIQAGITSSRRKKTVARDRRRSSVTIEADRRACGCGVHSPDYRLSRRLDLERPSVESAAWRPWSRATMCFAQRT